MLVFGRSAYAMLVLGTQYWFLVALRSFHGGSFAYVVVGYISFAVVGMVQRQRKASLSPRTFPFHNLIMSASTPQKSTTLGSYGLALYPTPPQGSQHNRGIGFGSSPSMRSKEWTFQVQGPNDYSSPAPSQHAVTTSVTSSAVPMMANPNAWTPDNLGTAIAHNLSQSVPYRYDLRDARSWAGMDNAPHGTFPVPVPIDHASPISWHHGMTASDVHPVVPAMANLNAWTPDNSGTAVAQNLSQSVPCVHDPGVVNPSFQLPPAWQSELPINRPPPFHCEWVDNNIRCRYGGTLKGLKRHWRVRHLPTRRRAKAIQCKWENCNYERGGTRLMCRSSIWRHISEVHLELPRQ
ncbi:hypothetical protein CY34DRAFT_190464 [Suillus luteus UH-Slu-Lm8-n1]|uniref:C2H2-type domain-containing protein n=1 Tax=Suillus luteus UH-Slu-Lm8-n1 TaxID=930992 RepID=A0A0D0BPJ2_9AGAM|nr:hypothetical protein CY34DRAFT_190464 [Suillus luteus UH-Slu-Lm8-n1]